MAYEMLKQETMTLPEALRLRVDVHTQDNDLIGYTVHFGAYADRSHQEGYIEAWGILRDHIDTRRNW